MGRVFDISLRVSPETCVVAAAMLLLIPFPWVIAWFAAAMWHELFHCLALILCSKPIHEISIGGYGAEIITGALTDGETLFCALAGPLGGLSLLFLSGIFPRLVVCGLIQSVCNLLPIYPLDGGRALRGCAGLLLSERWAKALCNAVELLLLGAILLIGFVLSFCLKLGLLPFILAVFFIVHTKKIKIPCK